MQRCPLTSTELGTGIGERVNIIPADQERQMGTLDHVLQYIPPHCGNEACRYE